MGIHVALTTFFNLKNEKVHINVKYISNEFVLFSTSVYNALKCSNMRIKYISYNVTVQFTIHTKLESLSWGVLFCTKLGVAIYYNRKKYLHHAG